MSSPSKRLFLSSTTLSLLVSIATTGCLSETDTALATTVPSTSLSTSELRGVFRLSGERGATTLLAQAQFSDARRDGVTVELAGEDAVYCNGVRLTTSMSFTGAELWREPVGEPYRFELRRAGGESVVVEVTALEEVAIVSPAASTEIRRAEPLTVQWTPTAGSEVEAQLFATCASTHAKELVESGSLTLPAFVPEGIPGGPQNAAPAPCDGTVSIVRTRSAATTTALAVTETVAEETHRLPVRVTE